MKSGHFLAHLADFLHNTLAWFLHQHCRILHHEFFNARYLHTMPSFCTIHCTVWNLLCTYSTKFCINYCRILALFCRERACKVILLQDSCIYMHLQCKILRQSAVWAWMGYTVTLGNPLPQPLSPMHTHSTCYIATRPNTIMPILHLWTNQLNAMKSWLMFYCPTPDLPLL